MPAITNRRVARLVIAAIVALLIAGCDVQTSIPAEIPNSSTSTPDTATTAAATPAALGPMTDQELGWLEAISRLHTTMDKVLTNSSPYLTPATLRSTAQQLRGCTHELARRGPATDRLQPVYQLAQRACAQYGEGAKCFDTAASIGILIAGTDAEQKFNKAIDCGFAAPGNGSALFADAEVKGFDIKQAAG